MRLLTELSLMPFDTQCAPSARPFTRPAARALHLWPALSMAALALVLTACSSDPKTLPENQNVNKLYEEAREEASSGTPERAIKLYERLEGLAAGTLLSQQAQLEQAFLLFKQQEKARALAIIERFLKLHPTSPAADYAYYLQGVINFNDDKGMFGNVFEQDLSERDQQASRDSYQSFKQVVERFPESRYASDAQARMAYIVNALAAYEVHVARHYFRRGAYIAAASRAQNAVQDFRGTPATEEALFLMAASYDRLKLTQLRDDAQRVLRTNYPTSTWLDLKGDGEDRPWWRIW